jgi:hypothetical protein
VAFLVHGVETAGRHTRIHFGQGLVSDPWLRVANEQLVSPAEPMVVAEAVAAFTFAPEDPVINPLDTDRVEIPTVVSVDGSTVTLAFTADETADMADWAGAYSWDLYVRTTVDDWQRVRQGTLTIQVGDAR